MIRGMEDALQAVKTKLDSGGFDCDWHMGDHQLLPRVPAGCILPGNNAREYVGAPRRVEATLQVFILLYHGEVDATKEDNTLAQAEFVDTLVDFLEEDPTFGDDLIDTFVPRVEFGETQLRRSKYISTRVTLNLRSRYVIGVSYE